MENAHGVKISSLRSSGGFWICTKRALYQQPFGLMVCTGQGGWKSIGCEPLLHPGRTEPPAAVCQTSTSNGISLQLSSIRYSSPPISSKDGSRLCSFCCGGALLSLCTSLLHLYGMRVAAIWSSRVQEKQNLPTD